MDQAAPDIHLTAFQRTGTLLALALSGCAALHPLGEPPADWPTLRIIDRGSAGLLAACSPYVGLLSWPPLGCAVVDMGARTCTIWYISQAVRVEELKHCEGRDHIGESTLADLWRRAKGTTR